MVNESAREYWRVVCESAGGYRRTEYESARGCRRMKNEWAVYESVGVYRGRVLRDYRGTRHRQKGEPLHSCTIAISARKSSQTRSKCCSLFSSLSR